MQFGFVTTLAVVGLAVAAPQTTRAQKSPAPFQVLKSEGTTQEKATYKTIADRFQVKAADTAFMARLDNAVAKKEVATARSLLANVAEVPPDQIFLALRSLAMGDQPQSGARMVLASARVESAANAGMFYLLFTVGKYVVCVGTRAACEGALRALRADILTSQPRPPASDRPMIRLAEL